MNNSIDLGIMKNMGKLRVERTLLGVALGVVACLIGCGKPADSGTTVPTATSNTPTGTTAAAGSSSAFKPDVDAGLPITPPADPKQWANLVAMNNFSVRQDPFALSSKEKSFDTSQETARLDQEAGNFNFMYEVPEPPSDIPEAVEAQPYRRLSGVLVGDSVLAIIEMGIPSEPQIVRPGQYVAGTEWKVISIDTDKAVLRRAGKIKPTEITVRLEQRPPGYGGGANSGYNGGSNAPGNFGPGGGGGASTGPRMGGAAGAGSGGAATGD